MAIGGKVQCQSNRVASVENEWSVCMSGSSSIPTSSVGQFSSLNLWDLFSRLLSVLKSEITPQQTKTQFYQFICTHFFSFRYVTKNRHAVKENVIIAYILAWRFRLIFLNCSNISIQRNWFKALKLKNNFKPENILFSVAPKLHLV